MSPKGANRHEPSGIREELDGVFFEAPVGIAQVGLDGAWLRVNQPYCQMFGYTEAELRTKRLEDLSHPDDWKRTVEWNPQFLGDAVSPMVVEMRYVRKDGTVFLGKLKRSLVRDGDARPKHWIAVIEDITEKTAAETALRDLEQQLVLAQTAGHLGLWERDLATGVTLTSSEFARLHGVTADQLPLRHEGYLKYVHPDDLERIQAEYRKSIELTHAWDTEFRVIWPDGSVHWLLGQGQVLLDASGKPTRLSGIALDITERKRAEAKLRESEERFLSMADAAPVMICASGPDKRATFFNRGWLEFAGRGLEQELDYGWTERLHPDDRDATLANYSASFDARGICNLEYRLRRADGEYRWLLCSGRPRFHADGTFTGYIASAIDITDVKRTQQETLARQKWESLGVLASGIAHDFGNLLGSILGQAELVGAPGEEIQRIKECALRGSEIVRQIMAYVGEGQDEPSEAADLSQIVKGMLELLKVSISKCAVLRANLGQDLPNVSGSAPQIRQLVMNLVINASEAIGEKEGVIVVTVDHPGDLVLLRALNLAAGDYLRLMVSDSGSGITDGVRERIFDPFFTTKSAGRGLGLAVVHGIVRSLRGGIRLSSDPDHGTTFEVFLPCAASTALGSGMASSTEELGKRFQEATVVVVEDEDALRQAVSKKLRNNGLSVVEASTGGAALEVIRAGNPSDLLLLDITLPGVPSRIVFEEAKRLHPEMSVIVTSAFSRDVAEATLQARIDRFIRKPYKLSDLIRLVRESLT